MIIENLRPDVREELGVDPDTLFSINPRLIYRSIKASALMIHLTMTFPPTT